VPWLTLIFQVLFGVAPADQSFPRPERLDPHHRRDAADEGVARCVPGEALGVGADCVTEDVGQQDRPVREGDDAAGAVDVNGGHAEPVLLRGEPGAVRCENAEGRDDSVEHRPPGKDIASDADRSAAEDGVVQAHRQGDRRYQHILVAADQVPVPADRAGRGAKHPPPSAFDYLTTPRLRHAAVDEVPQPEVEACRLGVEWLPVLGEPSKGDKHRGSLSLAMGKNPPARELVELGPGADPAAYTGPLSGAHCAG
jgi:hypothetical protein